MILLIITRQHNHRVASRYARVCRERYAHRDLVHISGVPETGQNVEGKRCDLKAFSTVFTLRYFHVNLLLFRETSVVPSVH